MKYPGIKYQLRITTLVPVFVVALLFAIFYNGQFNQDLKQHTAHLGEAYIRQLLPAAQLAMLHDDNRTLQALVDASSINPDIHSLAFYNTQGQLLVHRGSKHALTNHFTPPEFTGNQIKSRQLNQVSINFLTPITVPTFNLYALISPQTMDSNNRLQADAILGWLSIDIDMQSTVIKRYQMYLVTIFITLIGLLLSLIVNHVLSKRIYHPIARLRRSMKQILRNEFETQINASSQGELGIIEQGCLHLQQQYLNAVQDLNHNVEIATADLQTNLEVLEEKNIQLSLEKKKSEEKSRQKSEFIANMSHEIRTPMNGVIGFTNVLLESNLDPLQLDYVKTIKSSAQDLLTIINDILDYSKMDAGKLRLDSIPLDIRACIDDVLALVAPNGHKKGIEIIPSTALNVPKTVLGDALRIKQLISNLVSNAIKFTDHGYVLVETCVEEENDHDYLICLSVTDTGIGINAADQTTLFNAFSQADTNIIRRFGGSGLGLVICKKLAEQMGGRISIMSELHKGSTFSVYLRLHKLAAYEIEKHQTHRFSNLTVLCFDDNPLHLDALCNGLGHWGIQCIRITAFHQLEQALTNYSHCDLAFINVNQGCEPIIAQLLLKKTMPCILVSKWLIQDYQALGADGFLFKPPSIEKLHDAIESLLNRSTTRSSNDHLHDMRNRLRQAQATILIAEDNPVNRMLLNSILSPYATVEMVCDGEQAIQRCNLKAFNMILLDIQMPKVNGLEAARCIRYQSPVNNHTPIIFISANSNDVNHEMLQEAGVTVCLQKPLDEALLLHHLLTLIEKQNVHAINWPMCVQKVSGNEALAIDFLGRFVEELHANREEFEALMAEGNIKGLERAAHKLHGACCFCGVPELQTQVVQMEQQAKHAQHSEELQPIFKHLIESINAVISEYQQHYGHQSSIS
ncbi:MAG: response regulator [Legionella sp.]